MVNPHKKYLFCKVVILFFLFIYNNKQWDLMCDSSFVVIHYFNSNSSTRAVIVGGNWNNDLNCGLWYANNNSATNTNANYGGRLILYQIKYIIAHYIPQPLLKINRSGLA